MKQCQKDFRYILLNETGGHNWKENKHHKNTVFTCARYGLEYKSYVCPKCGMRAIKYVGHESYYVVPAYPRSAVFECPGELGLIDGPIDGSLSVALGDVSSKKKKKKKKKKKMRRRMVRTKWPVKSTKMKRTR